MVKDLTAPMTSSDRDDRLESGIQAWLESTGLDIEHKDLRETPQRVAALWRQSFLAGYRADPAVILGEFVDGEGATEMVIVRELPFEGMCPHHLLPFIGRATVAYLPNRKLVGFGRLAALVQCFTQRLTLQERACNEVADALMTHLDARGAACIMVGEHMCLRIPERRHHASVQTSSFRGELDGRDARERLLCG